MVFSSYYRENFPNNLFFINISFLVYLKVVSYLIFNICLPIRAGKDTDISTYSVIMIDNLFILEH